MLGGARGDLALEPASVSSSDVDAADIHVELDLGCRRAAAGRHRRARGGHQLVDATAPRMHYEDHVVVSERWHRQ